MVKRVEAVTVGYSSAWRKWPDSLDIDYTDVRARRQLCYYTVRGEPVVVNMRWYPVHSAYARAGSLQLPVKHPFIVNTKPPAQRVLDAMVADLEEIAKDGVKLCVWEHAYQCYPAVAQHLRRLFSHSVLIHADDCPGSTEIKTQPIAQYFDSAFHGNIIWTVQGDLTADLYTRLGVANTYYLTLTTTGGFADGLSASGFDLDRRLQQIREKRYTFDVVFAGGMMGMYRPLLNTPATSKLLGQARIRSRFVGSGMRDGLLLPRDPALMGNTIARLYLASFSTLNCPFIGLLSTRAYDAWASGTLLVQHDSVGELEAVGIKAGVHYADYDGTIGGLISTLRHYQARPDETERILLAGWGIGTELPAKYNATKAMESVLEKHGHLWGW